MNREIRLACTDCDRTDADGISEIPPGWEYVDEVQSYEEACTEVPNDDVARSAFSWWTHLGICPDCQEEGEMRRERNAYTG